MNYDTFGDSKTYKTLPYIIDAMNAMSSKKNKDRLASFLYKVNECANQIEHVRFMAEFLNKIDKTYKVNMDYFYQISIDDYKKKIEKFFNSKAYESEDKEIYIVPSPYAVKLRTHIENYIVTRFKIAVGLGNNA